VYVSLREGDGNTGFGELLVNGIVDFRPGRMPMVEVGQVAADLEIECIITEAAEGNNG